MPRAASVSALGVEVAGQPVVALGVLEGGDVEQGDEIAAHRGYT